MKAVVTGRLIVMFLLVVIRWILQPVLFVFMVLHTVFESMVTGLSSGIAHLQKLNNDVLTKAK